MLPLRGDIGTVADVEHSSLFSGGCERCLAPVGEIGSAPLAVELFSPKLSAAPAMSAAAGRAIQQHRTTNAQHAGAAPRSSATTTTKPQCSRAGSSRGILPESLFHAALDKVGSLVPDAADRTAAQLARWTPLWHAPCPRCAVTDGNASASVENRGQHFLMGAGPAREEPAARAQCIALGWHRSDRYPCTIEIGVALHELHASRAYLLAENSSRGLARRLSKIR